MKKMVALLLVLALLVPSVAGCGKKKVDLTAENVKDYLTFSSTVDCDIEEEKGSVLGFYYKNYSGDATADIRIINQSGAEFENVTMTLELQVYTFNANKEGLICGWEFKSENHHEGTNMADAINTKTVTVNLPYDGNWSLTEQLKLALYGHWSSLVTSPAKLSSVSVRVKDVSGTAIGGSPASHSETKAPAADAPAEAAPGK